MIHSWEDPGSSADAPAPNAASSTSNLSWEEPERSLPVRCDSDTSDDDEPIDSGVAFVEYCKDLLLARVLNAVQYCTIMRLAGDAGVTSAVRFGFRDNAPSGHYQRHLTAQHGNIGDRDKLYKLDIPGQSRT